MSGMPETTLSRKEPSSRRWGHKQDLVDTSQVTIGTWKALNFFKCQFETDIIGVLGTILFVSPICLLAVLFCTQTRHSKITLSLTLKYSISPSQTSSYPSHRGIARVAALALRLAQCTCSVIVIGIVAFLNKDAYKH
jgi:hypothetical protein